MQLQEPKMLTLVKMGCSSNVTEIKRQTANHASNHIPKVHWGKVENQNSLQVYLYLYLQLYSSIAIKDKCGIDSDAKQSVPLFVLAFPDKSSAFFKMLRVPLTRLASWHAKIQNMSLC